MSSQSATETRQNLEMQARQIQAYITLWHAKIVSGAYKLDDIKKATNTVPTQDWILLPEEERWVSCSDEEKLKMAIASLEAQTERMAELVDAYLSA